MIKKRNRLLKLSAVVCVLFSFEQLPWDMISADEDPSGQSGGRASGSFAITQTLINPRFGDRAVTISGELSSDYVVVAPVPTSGTFPGEAFNGLQITSYSIAGAQLDAPVDYSGLTMSRHYKGRLTGNALIISGTTTELYGNCNTEFGSFKIRLDASVTVNGVTKEYHSPEPCTQPAGAPKYVVNQGPGSFSLTIPFDSSAQSTVPWQVPPAAVPSSPVVSPAQLVASATPQAAEKVNTEAARVLTPFTGYAETDVCAESGVMLPGVPWGPGTPPNDATVASSELGQYEALLRHTMQVLRLLYGSMTAVEDKSFNAFWAPFFDHPIRAGLEYFRQIAPLLDETVVTLNNLDGLISNLGVSLEEVLLAGGDPASIAGSVAAAESRSLKAERAKLDDLVKKINALGNPPNPLAAKCKARKRHKQILKKAPQPETQPAVAERKYIPGWCVKGWWVLKESWAELHPQLENDTYVYSEPVIKENSAQTSSWYKTPRNNDPGLLKFAYSWSLPPKRIRAPWGQSPGKEHVWVPGEKFEITVEAHDEGSNSKEYSGVAIFADWVGNLWRRGTFKSQRVDWTKNEIERSTWGSGCLPVEARTSLPDKPSAETTGENRPLGVLGRTVPPEDLEAIFKVTIRGGSGGEIFYRYEFEPDDSLTEEEAGVADYDQAKEAATEQAASSQEDKSTYDPEKDPEVVKEAIDYHLALAAQARSNADRWAQDARSEKNDDRRKELEKRAAEIYANAQTEQDVADSLRTGTMVHTRTEWDERQHQELVKNVKEEIAGFALENKILANIPKVGNMVGGREGVDLREDTQKRISEAIKSPDRLKKLQAIYGELQNKVATQGEQKMATEQAKADMWEDRMVVAENVQFAASTAIMFGALWAPAEIGSLAIGFVGATGFAEDGVKGAVVGVTRSVSARADVLISAYEGAARIDPATNEPGGVWGAMEGALWSIGINKGFEILGGRIQKAKTDYALYKQGLGGRGVKAVAKAKGEARLKEYDFKTPEQRYKAELSAAKTPEQKDAVNKKYAIQAEREKMNLEKEGARQKAENDIRQGLDPAKAKENYNKDLDTINEKYEASETRNKEHLEVAEKLGFDTKEPTPEQKKQGIDNRDFKPVGSTPKNAAGDLDFLPQGKTSHEAYQKGKAYVEEMKMREHSVDEYGDRWVDNTSDTTIWKPGFSADKPGSSSFEAQVIFGTLPHSDKFGTKSGVDSASDNIAVDDPLGAVLANVGKAVGAGLGNKGPKDLHTIGKSASKCIEILEKSGVPGVEVDPTLKAQIDGLRGHKPPEQLKIVELGDSPATKEKKINEFLDKVEALMGRVYGSAKNKSDQNFEKLKQQADATGNSSEAFDLRSKLGAYKAGNDAALTTIVQNSPGLRNTMVPTMKVPGLTPGVPVDGKIAINMGGLAKELFGDRKYAETAPAPPANANDPAFAGLGKRCKEAASRVNEKLKAAKPGSDEAKYLAELKSALERGEKNPAEAVRTVRGLSGTELSAVLSQLGVRAVSDKRAEP